MPLNESNVYERVERGLSSARARGDRSLGNRIQFPADPENE